MKKVTLLGDSIRLLGYGYKVPNILGDDYEVFQPEDNCRFSKYTLRMIFELREDIENSDIIHWNNGLWDVSDLFGDGQQFTSMEEYKTNMLRIADLLLKITPNVIFATTTPVNDKFPYQTNEDIDRLNKMIVPELKEMGIHINDLYSLVYPQRDKYIKEDDMIHLTEEGAEVCAKAVADAIKQFEK